VAKRTILIDDATRAMLGGHIDVEAPGPVPLKGKTANVEVFAVVVKDSSSG